MPDENDEIRYQHHADTTRELQAVIARVAENHLGDRKDIVLANLERELTAAGHWPQPHGWMAAVAEEMEMGHIYRVGLP